MPTRRQIVFGVGGLLVLAVGLAVGIGIFATQKKKIVDCEMSEWGAWGPLTYGNIPCDKCGGGGEQTRTRTIKREPANGGTACLPEIETKNCKVEPACLRAGSLRRAVRGS